MTAKPGRNSSSRDKQKSPAAASANRGSQVACEVDSRSRSAPLERQQVEAPAKPLAARAREANKSHFGPSARFEPRRARFKTVMMIMMTSSAARCIVIALLCVAHANANGAHSSASAGAGASTSTRVGGAAAASGHNNRRLGKCLRNSASVSFGPQTANSGPSFVAL